MSEKLFSAGVIKAMASRMAYLSYPFGFSLAGLQLVPTKIVYLIAEVKRC